MQKLFKRSLLLILAMFLPSYSMNLTNNHVMSIQTNDNANISVDIKNDLPKSALKYLLKSYYKNFGYNDAVTPIRLTWSSTDLALFIKATHAIKNDISQWNFTDKECNTLLDMALAFKALDVYVALLGPRIPNKENTGLLCLPELNQHIAQLLLQLDNSCQFQTPQEEFVQKTINQTIRLNDKKEEWHLPKNIQYTHDKKYYITEKNNFGINIYDATTNTIIKEFKRKNRFTLFPTKNLVLIPPYMSADHYHDECLFLYDIDNDKLHTLISNISDLFELQITRISPNENFIAACHNSNVILWDISNRQNIIEHKQPHNEAGNLAFSPDNTMLISTTRLQEDLTNTNELCLWTINNTGLTCVTSLKSQNNIIPYFGNTNETFIVENIGRYITHQFCIKQHNNNYYITPSSAELYKSKTLHNQKHYNEFFYHDENDAQTQKITFHSLSKGIIHTHAYKNNISIKSSNNDRHIALTNRWRPKEIHVIHLSDDATYLGTSTQQLHQNNSTYSINIQFNQDNSLIILHTPNSMILCDTYGNHIKQYFNTFGTTSSLKSKFHPLGNALITKKSLLPLYDLNARPTLNTVTQNLTISQYALFKKINAQKRKEGECMKIKKNSFDDHSLKTLQTHQQEMIAKQLYLEINDK